MLGDSETTEVNKWSWNTHSNMLYIDQPVQAGFSYDTPTPGRIDLVSLYRYEWERSVNSERSSQMSGELNAPGQDGTYIEGTFGSGDMTKTASTTAQAAEAIWDFMQVWMKEKKFKHYCRDSISIWTQS